AIELRERAVDGGVTVSMAPQAEPAEASGHRSRRRAEGAASRSASPGGAEPKSRLRIYPYALSRDRLERAVEELGVTAVVTTDIQEADVLLTLKSHAKRQSQKLREARGRNVDVQVIRSNSLTQMENFLRQAFGVGSLGSEDAAIQEVEDAVIEVVESRRPVELSPQPRHI